MNKFIETDICMKIIKFQCVLIAVLVITLFGSQVYWSWYIGQWEYETYEYEVESEDGHAIINGEGEVIVNGESEKSGEEEESQE